jgi:hypothetical protein
MRKEGAFIEIIEETVEQNVERFYLFFAGRSSGTMDGTIFENTT